MTDFCEMAKKLESEIEDLFDSAATHGQFKAKSYFENIIEDTIKDVIDEYKQKPISEIWLIERTYLAESFDRETEIACFALSEKEAHILIEKFKKRRKGASDEFCTYSVYRAR